ncbi:hypothetical protein SAV31267_016600 [Streptomyces avermitilis]|uniref:Uncharacterized protein n=1 Tax=Streptomyces avermitilis TaxID=33903 RepID=A0A4D4MKL2_STRAX|nr:hypothetical protein SAVMC3_81960 [Streptomyces avermitilis]GDY72175.1 hypothetical protein SAV31267_016600 [Streptomyces avermitilis]
MSAVAAPGPAAAAASLFAGRVGGFLARRLPHLDQADATRQGVPARLTPVTWLRAFGEVVRSGLTIEETRLEPLLALRTAAGVAIVVGPALWLASPRMPRLPPSAPTPRVGPPSSAPGVRAR